VEAAALTERQAHQSCRKAPRLANNTLRTSNTKRVLTTITHLRTNTIYWRGSMGWNCWLSNQWPGYFKQTNTLYSCTEHQYSKLPL